jgi:hypothetical protein
MYWIKPPPPRGGKNINQCCLGEKRKGEEKKGENVK